MKYKIGDKVKYDGGDWWLYGTVSAVFEHQICPCYRLNVERMEKKSCKFSITQFEFELEPCVEEPEPVKQSRRWETSETEYLRKYYGKLSMEDLTKVLKRSPQELADKWAQTQSESESLRSASEFKTEAPAPKSKHEPEPKKAEAAPKIEKKAEAVKAPVKEVFKETFKESGVITEAWKRNLEDFKSGKKDNLISAWASQNRKEYRAGKLQKIKYDKLSAIGFVFDTGRKKKAAAGTSALRIGRQESVRTTSRAGVSGA